MNIEQINKKIKELENKKKELLAKQELLKLQHMREILDSIELNDVGLSQRLNGS